MNDFTDWLNRELTERGWGYNELARRAGVSGGSISHIMNQRKNPHLRQPPKRLWPGVLVVLGGVGVITGLILVLNGESPACLGFGAVLAVAGVLLWMASKTRYLVIIGSSSGETQALRSTDQGYVEKIVAAMNEAIIKRG